MSLSQTHPDLVREQWNYDLNEAEGLDPTLVTRGSNKRAWWTPPCCGKPYQARVGDRVKGEAKCPVVHDSLAVVEPDLVREQWNYDLNEAEGLDPTQVTRGSQKRAWWTPPCCGKPYQGPINERVRGSSLCPVVHDSLAVVELDLVREQWNYDLNTAEGLDPTQVTRGSNKRAWWTPPCCGQPYQAVISQRVVGNALCPVVHDSLAVVELDLVREQWNYDLNTAEGLDPTQVTRGSNKRAWWTPPCCGKPYQAAIEKRVQGKARCPDVHDSLAATEPELVTEQWNYQLNETEGLDPALVKRGSDKRAWWTPPCCGKPYQARVGDRVKGEAKCPVVHDSLAVVEPDLVREQWNYQLNETEGLDPSQLTRGSDKRAWWTPPCCGKPYQAKIRERVGSYAACPCVHSIWTAPKARQFLRELMNQDSSFTPAQRWVLAERAGLLDSVSKRKAAKNVLGGRGSHDDIQALVGKMEPGDEVLLGAPGAPGAPGVPVDVSDAERYPAMLDSVSGASAENDSGGAVRLPAVSIVNAMAKGISLLSGGDDVAVGFLLRTTVSRLWESAYKDEAKTLLEARAVTAEGSTQIALETFLREYEAARGLEAPVGWIFPSEAKLMQRHVAAQVLERRRVGNWSQAGTGKTLSAVLASRAVHAGLTVVVCPNAVAGRTDLGEEVAGWHKAILEMLNGDHVAIRTNTFTPLWSERDRGRARFLIVHVEMFQQEGATEKVRAMVAAERIDMVVIDEIQSIKRRGNQPSSRRRILVEEMIVTAGKRNPNLAVLGMTATPVVNELAEAVSLLQIITGESEEDLWEATAKKKATVSTAMDVHQRLVLVGTRSRYEDAFTFIEDRPRIDLAPLRDTLMGLREDTHPGKVEAVLTAARLPALIEACSQHGPTLLYTEYTDTTHPVTGVSVLDMLKAGLEGAGLRVARQTGEHKEIALFKDGQADVLIGSSAVATGVDGLQRVSRHLAINAYPWTGAAWEQLVGRIARTGQDQTIPVRLTLPHPFLDTDNGEWCYDAGREARITNKRTIADAAVDGFIPDEETFLSEQAASINLMRWLKRLDSTAGIER